MIKYFNIELINLESKASFQYLLLTLITLIAIALRFYNLGEWSFWGDEMFTVGGREDGFNYSIVRESISLRLIQATVAFLGPSEWNARLVPAIIGVISIPVFYSLVKKMSGPAVGLVAALLLAVSPWHLYWSQNARFYTSLLLFYTLALLTFYFGLEKDRPWYLLVSLLCLGLAAKERLIALFFVPVVLSYLILLFVLPFEKPPGLRWRNLVIFAGLALIPIVFFAGPYVLNLSKWLAGFGYANNSPVWILAGVVFYIGLPTVCMAVLGALYFLSKKSRASLLLSLGAAIPLLTMTLISPFHYTANRYVFVSLLSWIILASLAAVELLVQAPKHIKILAVGVLIFLVLHPLSEDVLYHQYQNGNRDNWKTAFESVRKQKQVGDLVVAANTELGDYYLQDKTMSFRSVDLASIEEGERRVWFVEDMVAQQIFPDVHNWLKANTQQVANLDVHIQARNFKMRVYLYDPVKNPPNAIN
ncbi:glycosyltransferase family 39 protein [Chloroflexota bacterium]